MRRVGRSAGRRLTAAVPRSSTARPFSLLRFEEPSLPTPGISLIGLVDITRALEAEDLPSALRVIATSSARLIPGTRAATVTLWRDDSPYTTSASDDVALPVDEAQYADRSGPCVEAARTAKVVQVDDIAGALGQWPAFSQAALDRGLLSSLSLPLVVGERVVGGLNLYGTTTSAFEGPGREAGEVVAAHGGSVALGVSILAEARALADQLAEAMRSRAVIDQAIGIVMSQRHCNADQALEFLVAASQRSNTKLREIAARLVTRTAEPGER